MGQRFRALLLRYYPELTFFSRGDLANEALTGAKHDVMRSWRFWLLNIPCWLGICIVVSLGFRWLSEELPGLEWLADKLADSSIYVFFPAGCAFWLYRKKIRRSLREQLVKLGIPICVYCAYDLRGQTVPRCPECGRPFDQALIRQAEESTPLDN